MFTTWIDFLESFKETTALHHLSVSCNSGSEVAVAMFKVLVNMRPKHRNSHLAARVILKTHQNWAGEVLVAMF